MKDLKKYIPGVIFVLFISILSMYLNDLLKRYIQLEAVTIAILIGILYSNSIGTGNVVKDGIQFSLKKLLKVGIVLLGFKLNLHAILKLGPKVLIMVMIFIPIALIMANVIGRIFKVNTRLSTLIGVGSSICGASAIVAISACINANDDDSVIAVSTVSLLGAVGVIVYSAVAASDAGLTAVQYGTWSGLSLQGVAHALAAAFALGDASGEIGTFVKMTRVLMLVPVSVVLSYLFKQKGTATKKAKFPMYVLYFILAGVIHSLGIIPSNIIKVLTSGSSIFILMSMTAMGLLVNLKSILNKGIKAMVNGIILFILLSVCSLVAILQIL